MGAQFTADELAAKLNGSLIGGPGTTITGVAGVDTAESGDIVFAESPRFLAEALRSRAAAVLVTEELATGVGAAVKPLIQVASPRLAFVQVLEMFAEPLAAEPGIHPTAQIGDGVSIAADVRVGANVVIGAGVTLDPGVVVMAGVVVGDHCSIAAGTILYPNVVLYAGVKIGKQCILHAGCIIGADGFGYVQVGFSLKKVPQLGTVELGDAVEIGANTCIDRAKTGVTRIGSGTKIDNLVHIAHNVTVGQSCLLIAQAGVAGSVTIGNGVVLAGQAGVKDHVTLGDGARVGAQGGVIGDVPAGMTVSGYPARPHHLKMREHAAAAALPDALKRLRVLERRLAEMEIRFGLGATVLRSPHPLADPGSSTPREDASGGGYEREDSVRDDVGPVG